MKKILLVLGCLIFTNVFSQAIEFSKDTRKLFDKLMKEYTGSGLSKDDALRKTLDHPDYQKLQYRDLADSNKKASKEGIIFSKNFAELATHKSVAIVPFDTDFVDNKTKVQSKKDNIKKEKDLSELIQESLYKYLMGKQFEYSVDFQDIAKSNQILKSSGAINTLTSTTGDELAKLLNVDAVISGSYKQVVDKSSGAQKITSIMSTGMLGSMSARAKGTVKILITDRKSGDILWRMEYDEDGSAKNAEDIVADIMKQVTKYFPYGVKFSNGDF